jgi:hypothetical protein
MVAPAYNSTQLLKNIRLDQLDIKSGEISGDLISGGSISAFASTGIDDKATVKTLTIEDGLIVVDRINAKQIGGGVHVKGDMHIAGNLTVERLRAVEIISERTFDKMFLEFKPVDTATNPNGSGLIWKGGTYTKLFVLKNNDDRFFSSESIDLANDKSYKIDNIDVLTKNALGSSIRKSSLREVGTLHSLTVTGDVSLSEFISISSDQQRIGINFEQPVGALTISDFTRDVVLNFDIENGRGKVGTYNQRPFDLTAGDQVLVSLEPKGIISFGHEYKSDTVTRAWGRLGVNVKHPEADLDVRDSIKFGGKLFMVLNSPPKTGNYKRGDIVWNELPTNKSPVGWVCTVSGTPGTWASFGEISE